LDIQLIALQRVQFKVRVVPDLVHALGIQNFEKTAKFHEFHEGVYFHPRMGAFLPCAGIESFVEFVAFSIP
jgi:hypothetical protein